MSANETVREVCAEMLEPSSTCKACDFVQCPMLAKDAQVKNLMEINDQVRDNLLEAMKSVSAKDAEIARLKAALKPMIECDIDYDPWSWMGESLDNEQMDSVENMHNAVREAQRIMKEGGEK